MERHFGFRASSCAPPRDGEREGAGATRAPASPARLAPHPPRYVLDPGDAQPRRQPPLWTLAGPQAWPPVATPVRRGTGLLPLIAALILCAMIATGLAASCRFGLFGLCRDPPDRDRRGARALLS